MLPVKKPSLKDKLLANKKEASIEKPVEKLKEKTSKKK